MLFGRTAPNLKWQMDKNQSNMLVNLLFLTIVVLGLTDAKGAPVTTKPSPCNPNETYTGDNNCLTACPPTCGDEFAGAVSVKAPNCITVCAQRDCSCKNFYVRDPRNFGRCVLRKDCTPPCGPNEIDTSAISCNTPCPPTCKTPIPFACTANCAWRACSCLPGYYLNDAGKCVSWTECPPIPDPCKNHICPPDQDCVSRESDCGNPPCPPEAICVPRKKPFDCSTYPCRRCGFHCEMVHDDPNCQTTECNQHPECVPKNITCDGVWCEEGQQCRLVPVVCITCPCFPQPTCLQPPCSPHSSFKLNCKACEKTCPPSSVPDPCIIPCAARYDCYCDDGYLRDPDGNCVLLKDCPGCG